MKPPRRALALASLSPLAAALGCAAAVPSWYPVAPHGDRRGAYELFLVASGSGDGRDRVSACEAADAGAHEAITSLFVEHAETQSEVIAVAGGPSRVRTTLHRYAAEALRAAPRTRESYDQAVRRCWVEVRWLLPRYLAADILRTTARPGTEADVALEMKRALGAGERERAQVQRDQAAPGPQAALDVAYPRWYARVLSVEGCDTHRVAFVGAPGGGEARWLELKQSDAGWLIVNDRRVPDEGWPSAPPAVTWCD